MISDKKFWRVYSEFWGTIILPPVFFALIFIVFLVFGSVPNLTNDWAKMLWSIFALATVFAVFWILARLASLSWDRTKRRVESEFAASEKKYQQEHS